MNTKLLIKFLTLAVVFLATSTLQANVEEQAFNTHLRWNIAVPKNQILVSKSGSNFYIETLNLQIYNQIKSSLAGKKLSQKYFKNIRFQEEGFPEKPARVLVGLAGDSIELFSFYKDGERKYILDFWVNEDNIDDKISQTEKKKESAAKAKVLLTKKPEPKKVVPVKKAPVVQKITTEAAAGNLLKTAASKKKVTLNDLVPPKKKQILQRVQSNKEFRDYRYGASFIWDHEALSPVLEKTVNIQRKTPEFFYPIKDRAFDKNEREAHIQLTINLYRKGKWGLMSKSIRLYEQKYGDDKYKDINDYIRANAIIRENLNNDDKGPFKLASNLLSNIYERTKNYELKRAVLMYLNQYNLQAGNHIDVLRLSKKLYVYSKADFDRETTAYAAKSILYALAQLGQIKKIMKFTEETSIKKLLPAQSLIAYKIYAQIKLGNAEEAIRQYEKAKSSLRRPIEPSILYNVGEAMFRESKYNDAVKLFDSFIDEYSFMKASGMARLRIAMAYEIQEKDIGKTIELYKNAINRSTDGESRFEAKLRYVGLRNIRKYNPNARDKETLIFMDHTEDEKPYIKGELKHLLWLVRLRSLINQEQFTEALTYLSSIPLTALKPVKRKVFEGDGAEIVYGLVKESYENQDFSRVVKLWEIYRNVYNDKVAMDPYINFLVSHSYLKLGLNKSFERTVKFFEDMKETVVRTYPRWVDRVNVKDAGSFIKELNLLKKIDNGEWEEAEVLIGNFEGSNLKKLYYQTIVSFNLKKFDDVIKKAEQFLAGSSSRIPLNKAEIFNFFSAYVESIYNLGDLEKFQRTANALLSDIKINSSKDKKIKELKEKISYLNIEILFGQGRRGTFLELEPKIQKFLTDYKESFYKDRVEYLYGITLSRNGKNQEALKILDTILANEEISDYIKELSRSEIATIKLKEKNI